MTGSDDDFEHLDPGELRDAELSVVLAAKIPADPVKGWAPAYGFELWVDESDKPVGKINLRVGDNYVLRMYAGHIGYGVDPDWRGRHYAERAVRLILPLAKRHGISTIWITCNPDNWASRRTCERLGAEMIEIVPLPPDNEMYINFGDREKCRYRLEL
jgi:tagatose 1,6-diphosphate aldolase